MRIAMLLVVQRLHYTDESSVEACILTVKQSQEECNMDLMIDIMSCVTWPMLIIAARLINSSTPPLSFSSRGLLQLCDALDVDMIIHKGAWHQMNNILTITLACFVLVYLMGNRNEARDHVLR